MIVGQISDLDRSQQSVIHAVSNSPEGGRSLLRGPRRREKIDGPRSCFWDPCLWHPRLPRFQPSRCTHVRSPCKLGIRVEFMHAWRGSMLSAPCPRPWDGTGEMVVAQAGSCAQARTDWDAHYRHFARRSRKDMVPASDDYLANSSKVFRLMSCED